MFVMTEAAGARLRDLLDKEDCPNETAIRLVKDGKGIAMRLDEERSGDTEFRHEGRTVLYVDDEVVQLLAGNRLDIDRDTERLALVGVKEK